MKDFVDVSVNITTLNRPVPLAMLLESIMFQTVLPKEIVIVDGSNPSVLTSYEVNNIIVALKCMGINVIVENEIPPGGNCQARNQALHSSTYELILRLDDDSILQEDYIERLYKIISKDNKAGAVGGLVPMLGMPPYYFEMNDNLFDRIEFDKDGNITLLTTNANKWFKEDKVLPTRHIQSCMMFRKSAAIEIGGFPTDYSKNVAFREETDFCLRLQWKGWKLFVDTGAIAFHNMAQSGGCRNPAYNMLVTNDNVYFLKKMKQLYRRDGSPWQK